MFKILLVAVDGSEHGQRAARVAAELAQALNVKEIRLVVAYDPIPGYLGQPNLSRAIAARTREAEAILERARTEFGKTSANVVTEILEGSTAETILKVATVRKSDMIVMGSRGRGRLQGALLGSNSQKVVSHAPCPVLVVR